MTREASVNRPSRPHVPLGAPFWAWAALVLTGLVVMSVADRLLVGGLLVATGFALAAVLRLLLPDSRAGGLHLRGRNTDIAMHTVIALAVAAASILVHTREGD